MNRIYVYEAWIIVPLLLFFFLLRLCVRLVLLLFEWVKYVWHAIKRLRRSLFFVYMYKTHAQLCVRRCIMAAKQTTLV